MHTLPAQYRMNAQSPGLKGMPGTTKQRICLLHSFAYWHYLRGNFRKPQLWYKFYIETTGETHKSKENQLKCDPYNG